MEIELSGFGPDLKLEAEMALKKKNLVVTLHALLIPFSVQTTAPLTPVANRVHERDLVFSRTDRKEAPR